MDSKKTSAKKTADTRGARLKLLIRLIAASWVLAMAAGCATAPGQVYTPPPPPVDGESATACFYDFPDVYVKRIYPVLDSAPGLLDLRRADQACYGESSCICYDLLLSYPLEDLESWVYRELRTSKAVPFQSMRTGSRRIEFRHQGGFD